MYRGDHDHASCREASAEQALGGRSLPPNVDIQTRPKTHEHTPNDSQRPTDIPPVTVTVTLSREVGMIIVVTIVHTSVPSAAALVLALPYIPTYTVRLYRLYRGSSKHVEVQTVATGTAGSRSAVCLNSYTAALCCLNQHLF